MANLTTRTAATSLSDGDLLYALIDPSGTPLDRKIAKENILKDLPADAVDAITEIAAALKSGADGTLVTGTAGTNGNAAQWNADGDIVDGPGSASTTAAGFIEVATAAETDTGTDAARAVSPDGLAGSAYGTAVVTIQIFDDGTDVATGDGAGDTLWRVPSTLNGFDLVAANAYHQTAGTTGTTTVMVHNLTQAADMLSTAITISTGDLDSADGGSSAAGVIDTLNDDVATADKIRIDVDGVTTTAPKGLWVELQFRLP